MVSQLLVEQATPLRSAVNAPLSYGSPESVGLLSAPLKELQKNTSAYTVAQNCTSLSIGPHIFTVLASPLRRRKWVTSTPPDPADSSASYNLVQPLYPGATVLVGHRNTIVSHFSTGYNLLYSDSNGTKLSKNERIRMSDDSIYDMVRVVRALGSLGTVMRRSIALQPALLPCFWRWRDETCGWRPPQASLSKMFTTVLALQQLGEGRINLNDTVDTYLPDFARVSVVWRTG
jgi:hypothetical protein